MSSGDDADGWDDARRPRVRGTEGVGSYDGDTVTGSSVDGGWGDDADAVSGEVTTVSCGDGDDTPPGTDLMVSVVTARGSAAADARGASSPVGVSRWVGTDDQGTESIMARSALGGGATMLVVSTVLPMSEAVESFGARKNVFSGKTRSRPVVRGAACWGP